MLDPLDHLDVSLQDFEPHPHRYGPPPLRRDETDVSDPEPDPPDSASAGGYSPPAWRRLENGRKSSGFWRAPDNLLRPSFGLPPSRGLPHSRGSAPPAHTRESSPEALDSDDEDDVSVLARAMRTRLPTGSLSPEKGNSPEPDRTQTTIKIDDVVAASKTPVAENCKFASVTPFFICIPLVQNRPTSPFVHSLTSLASKTYASPCAPRSNKGLSQSTPP